MKLTRRTGLWWLSPTVIVVAMTFPLMVLAHATPADRFLRAWRTPRHLDRSTFWLFSAMVAALLAGILFSAVLSRKGHGRAHHETLHPLAAPDNSNGHGPLLATACTVLFRLTLLGYVAWLVSAARSGVTPGEVMNLMQSADTTSSALRDRVGPIPGVTTLTQFGIGAAILCALGVAPGSTGRRRIVILLVLATARAFLLNERLALIEIVVPLAVIGCGRLDRVGNGWRRRLVVLAPVLAVPSLVIAFALFEYSRSWTWYSENTDDTYSEFIVTRLSGYYVTAFNNGALGMEHDRWEGRLAHDSLALMWELPGVDRALSYESVTGRSYDEYRQGLFARFGNDEFNSPSGLATPLIDFGVIGGLGFLFAIGLVVGSLHQSFVAGRLNGILLYPIVFVGLLELPRYLYWTAGRAAPAAGAMLAVSYLVRRPARLPRVVFRKRPRSLSPIAAEG